jgi:hypothetical protein
MYMNEAQSRSKTGKKQKNLYLSDQARQLLAILARTAGISETSVVELLIREKAARDNLVLPEADAVTTAWPVQDRRRQSDHSARRAPAEEPSNAL